MESKQDINDFEQALRTDLHQYLLSLDKVDERLPEAPDIEGLWPKIGESYLPDGMLQIAAAPPDVPGHGDSKILGHGLGTL